MFVVNVEVLISQGIMKLAITNFPNLITIMDPYVDTKVRSKKISS